MHLHLWCVYVCVWEGREVLNDGDGDGANDARHQNGRRQESFVSLALFFSFCFLGGVCSFLSFLTPSSPGIFPDLRTHTTCNCKSSRAYVLGVQTNCSRTVARAPAHDGAGCVHHACRSSMEKGEEQRTNPAISVFRVPPFLATLSIIVYMPR